MSTDYNAVTVVGFIVKKSNFFKKISRRGCSHNEQAGNYCSECGAIMWQEDVQVIDGFDENRSLFLGNNIKIVRACDGEEYVCFGDIIESNIAPTTLLLDNIHQKKEKLAGVLAPINLNEDKLFGIHVILSVI